MDKTTSRVLKAEEVKMQGCFHLDVNAPSGRSETAADTGLSPAARIVQNHPAYAVIEVTCACGKITRVRCEYGNA